jgi:hypothetical protein
VLGLQLSVRRHCVVVTWLAAVVLALIATVVLAVAMRCRHRHNLTSHANPSSVGGVAGSG